MILSVANIKKTINYCKKNGIKDTLYASAERVLLSKRNKYSYLEPEEEEVERQKKEIESFEIKPKFSLLVPAYETDPLYIEDLVLSVEEQSYLNLELIIADASKSDYVERMVKELQEQYGNIVYKRLDSNGGISVNTNAAMDLVNGDYVGLLDHDDLITKDALYYIAREINKSGDKSPVLIYTDEDKTDSYLDKYYEPNIKTGINKGMIMTNNYVCHLSVYRRDVIQKLRLRPEYDGAQDYDLVLRTIKLVYDDYGEDALKERIKHIPHILYHWRCHSNSTAENPESKMYAYEAGKNAVQDFLNSLNIKATVNHIKHLGFYRVDYEGGALEANKKIGAVGGPIYRNGKTIAGAMDGKGKVLYKDLPMHFSGYLNRAKLQQTVAAVDVRNIQIRDEYKELFKEIVGLSYPVNLDNLPAKYDDEYFYKKSQIFCNKLRNLGIEIMYEPEMEKIL